MFNSRILCDKGQLLNISSAAKRLQEFWRFLKDDMALLQAARARWTIVPAAAAEASAQQQSDSIDAAQNGQRHVFGLRIAFPAAAVEICSEPVIVGSGANAAIRLESSKVSASLLANRLA